MIFTFHKKHNIGTSILVLKNFRMSNVLFVKSR